jgi:hypothetical protein
LPGPTIAAIIFQPGAQLVATGLKRWFNFHSPSLAE